MRVLIHGVPFCCTGSEAVQRYAGEHELRTVGVAAPADYIYDPAQETAAALFDRIAHEWPPDVLLFWMPEMYPPPLGIEDVPVRTAAVVSDWNVHFPVLAHNLARFDGVLCDPSGAEALSSPQVRAEYLCPLYAHVPSVHQDYGEQKDIDVLFVGNLNHAAQPQRAHYLERLAKLPDRYRVVITTGVEGEDYGRLMNRARVVFNHSIRGELNLRVFESIAAGAVPVLEESNLEVAQYFQPGEDVVLYSPGDFEETLQRLLDDQSHRERIQRNAAARLEELSTQRRLNSMIEWASGLDRNRRGFSSLPARTRKLETLRMVVRCPLTVYRQVEKPLLDEALSAERSDPAFLTLAAIAAMANDKGQALDLFTRASDAAPESAVYALNLATVCRACGEVGKERAALDRTLEADITEGAEDLVGTGEDPFYVRWLYALARSSAALPDLHAEALRRKAENALSDEETAVAVEAAEHALALNPNAHECLPVKAESLWRAGRTIEAMAILREASVQLPMQLGLRETLCSWYIAAGAPHEARQLAQETLTIARRCVDPPVPRFDA